MTDRETTEDRVSPESDWPKLTRQQLITLARRIMDSDGTEDEIDALADQFESAVLMPHATALMFWPENHAPAGVAPNDYTPTPEEVVDRILAYRPIILGSGDEST